MAKLNIHDLAKELKREESEIISLCSSKGMSGVTRATMLQDTMVEEVRKAFKKPAEPADAAADKDGAPKKKLRLLFHPENSTKPISKKKRPDSAKKPEGDKAEKSVDKQEKAAERTESTKPAEKAQEMAKTEAPKETMTRENTKNDRNDSRSTNDGNRRDNSRRDGGNGQNGQRRDGNGQGGQRREGGYGQRDGQRRDGNGQGGQRREGGYGQRDGQRRDGNNQGGYGQRRDGNGQGGYGQRDGQRRDGNGQGGYGQRDGQRRDGNGQGGYGQRRDSARGQRTERENLDSMGTGMTKSEARGGKGLNKKEREIREKERQNQEKNTRFTENTRNISKMKQQNSKKPEPQPKAEEDDGIKTITIPETLTLAELAEAMKLQPAALVKSLFMKGTMMTINAELTFEQAEEIALEFNYICEKEVKVDVIEELLREEDDPEETKVSRPPVVCVMGHVDHGKTSLLDYIRKSNVIAGEAGGITQHIGAYNVKLPDGRRITFLDTPGHEAFTAMRARGAQLTDLAIIIIAADDAVMPQTVEAINHAQAAGVPMVFAINKIDKPGAQPERIYQQLAQMNILTEAWGGKYQCQEISAKKGLNVDKLLEKVLLETDLLDLKANPNKNGVGAVIESSLDKGRGYLATVLVQDGTLKTGDMVLSGSYYGRVKAMFNERGQKVKEAGPSTPVSILGLNGAPSAGDKFNVMSDEKEAKAIANKREQLLRIQGIKTQKHMTLEEIGRRIAIGNFKELNVIVKGDVDGSVEALSDSLIKLSTEQVRVNVIHKAVGAISESDVILAEASDAVIIGFQVRPSTDARKLADEQGIEIRLYSVIYDAINDVKDGIEGMLEPIKKEEITGTAEVKQTFKISKVGTIAGCLVRDGKIAKTAQCRLIRDGIVVYTGELASLKRGKDDVKEVSAGMECGIGIDKFNDLKVGDNIEAFVITEIKQTLD